MSLTSQLGNKTSPLRQFLERELPDTPAVAAAYRAKLPRDRVLVLPAPPDGVRPVWGTLAGAIDHRLRYSLSAVEPSGAVDLGVASIQSAPVRQAGLDLRDQMLRLVTDARPDDRARRLLLDPDTEETLDGMCYAAAWYEEVFRTGQVWPGTPLLDQARSLTLDSLLAAVPRFAVADIAAVVRLAEEGLAEIRAGTRPDDVQLGPTFTGSMLVGGADADWVADGLLCDVKSTTNPHKLKREDMWQLIGYVLLDFDDEHRIDRVGWYVTRAGCLIDWTTQEFMGLLGSDRPLAALRQELSEVLIESQPIRL